jgi:hypothetical protein
MKYRRYSLMAVATIGSTGPIEIELPVAHSCEEGLPFSDGE